MTEAIRLTLSRLINTLPIDKMELLTATGNGLNKLTIKFGLDGSGRHNIYRQLNNVETNNLILYMFCPLEIRSANGCLVWEQEKPNSAQTQRALAIQLGKESKESLRSIHVFNEAITALKNAFRVESDDGSFEFVVDCPTGMWDRKVSDYLIGTFGAYCDLCTYSMEMCSQKDVVADGIEINRTVESCNTVFETLANQDNQITKRKGDYNVRQGITSKPLLKTSILSV